MERKQNGISYVKQYFTIQTSFSIITIPEIYREIEITFRT